MQVYDSKQGKRRSTRWRLTIGSFIGIASIFSFIFISPIFFIRTHAAPPATTLNSWSTYAFRPERTGYNNLETLITPSTAGSLKQLWSFSTGSIISVQPIITNGLIYWGSWDGIFHANRSDGTMAWTANLGQSPTPPACSGRTHGVMGAATFAQATINGISTPVVFVGGGKDTFYALNASTGAIIWQKQLSSPPTDIWYSSLYFNSSVYISTSAWGDCPLVQAQIFRIDAATGTIQNVFNVVPNGCTGASVWGSVSIDTSNSTLYFATGNGSSCSQPETNAVAVVELNATNLAFISSWQVPSSQMGPDSDFGNTPTVFTATIGGTIHRLVGVANKNGLYYALDEARISSGPVWQQHIAIPGQAPEYGQGSISPSAWDGTNLYIAGGNTTINGQSCKGAVRAVNPATGAFIWQACLNDGPVLGPVSAVPGVVAVGEGNALVLLSSSTGNGLFKAPDTTSTANQFYGGPAIVNGSLYIGNEDGKFYAFGVSGTSAPPPPLPSSTPGTSKAPVSKTWYFAEGKVGQGFTEFLTVENSGAVSCAVTIQYLLGSGAPVTVPVNVPPFSRYTESVNSDLHLTASGSAYQTDAALVSVTNATCTGVVAERPMYFTNFKGVSSGTDVVGATHTGTNFYFADVSSLPSYHSYITILNPPGGATASITATYYQGGNLLGTDTLAVPAGTRGTIIPKSFGQRVATWVHASGPVVVERPTYFSAYSTGTAHTISGAASVVGASAPATDWRFAEGYTGGGFQENLLLANFGTTAASGKVVLEYDNGSTLTNTISVPARSVVSLDVNNATASKQGSCAPTPCVLSQSVSAEITVSAGAIAAEREMFFQYNHFDRLTGRTVTAQGGTDVTGQAGPARTTIYSFAEGYTNLGYDEWFTVQNPTATQETLAVTLVNGKGRYYTFSLPVGGHTRATVNLVDVVVQHLLQPSDGVGGYEISVTVQGAAGGVFVAERPMYWSTGSSGTQGGSDVLGYMGN